jgi:hypothetical protein
VTVVLDYFGKLVKMNGRRDATKRRRHGGAQRTRSRASVAARQVVAMHGVAELDLVWSQDKITAHGASVVDDEPHDESDTRHRRSS